MKRKLRAAFFWSLVASLLASGGPTSAHHGNAGAYWIDATKELALTGTVTQFKWGNPHVYVMWDVMDDKGGVAHWAAETRPPYLMAKSGWTRETLKPGDQVTITVFPAKGGAPVGLLSKVVLGGKLIYDDEQQRLAGYKL
jgi:hypothetical protein